MRLIAFDLDDTIAKLNRPASRRTVEELLDFERKGVRIALLSGKPASYLSGFVRQMGLVDPIISGENGVTVQYGAKFPPSQFLFTIELDKHSVEALRTFEEVLRKKFLQDVWIQPNIVNLTSFPVRKEVREVLFEFFLGYVEEHKQEFDGFKIYKHIDCIELVPPSVDKGVALKKIMEIEKLGKDQVGAVGDSVSDVPMFEQVENSFGIGIGPVKHSVRSIGFAIREIKRLLQFS